MPVRTILATLFSGCLLATTSQAGQPLETETARFSDKGTLSVEFGMERQTSTAGTEFSLPFAIEYSPANNLEVLIEPVPYTSIHNKGSSTVDGIGDLEVTVSRLMKMESGLPAVALAAEVKAPTARNDLIGSGKTDLTGYVILSKRFGSLDSHFNAGYTLVGKPRNVNVRNTYNLALAGEYHLSRRTEAVAEVLYTSAAIPDAAETTGNESTLAPEIGGDELVGMLGARVTPARGWPALSLGVTYDNNKAFLVRPGLTLRFR